MVLSNWVNMTGSPPSEGTRQSRREARFVRVKTISRSEIQVMPLTPPASSGASVVSALPSTAIFRRLPSGAPKAIQRPSGENSGVVRAVGAGQGPGIELVEMADVEHPAGPAVLRRENRLLPIGGNGEVGGDIAHRKGDLVAGRGHERRSG